MKPNIVFILTDDPDDTTLIEKTRKIRENFHTGGEHV